MTAAMGMVFAACEPTLIDGPEPFAPVDATVLANGITYQQFADEACTQPDEAGNFLKFNSASGIVQVFVEGNESPLFTGAGGVVKIPVKRGQEPSANLIFRIVNGDGTFTDATKTLKCTPPTELAPEMLILVSDNGKKVWKYAATNSYGNGGHGGAGADFNGPGVVGGNWWGVATGDELIDQVQHAGGAPTGDESSNAYMVFEGNTVTTYGPDGTKIRGGEWTAVMNDYASGAGRGAAGWELGKLTTSEPAILFPWIINGGGTPATEFDIMYYDANNMTLVNTNGQASGGWGEITHWVFVRK